MTYDLFKDNDSYMVDNLSVHIVQLYVYHKILV